MLKRTLASLVIAIASLASLLSVPAIAAKGGHGGHGGGGGCGPVSYIQGVDVSHYNGTINWSAVKAAGRQFAIAKVTEGQTFLDNMYATNKTGATAADLKFTAYHFARPDTIATGDTITSDAVKEADWFVSNAQLSHGNLVPALDLEVHGTLTVSQLTTWVQTWLARVATDMGGVKAMIYTSPSFWQTYMGNSTWFASNGYTVLWIAHWTSDCAPTVPASNWGGHSWTFWQWTSCAQVSGISGCVDGDRFHYTDFSSVTIP
jgi:GH25 family lysozyme M1 (1,4-beta-N-acetylmuramidase)